jgi:hypothetical protein
MPSPASSINHSAFEHAPVAAKIVICTRNEPKNEQRPFSLEKEGLWF